jgi:hypothetical protein
MKKPATETGTIRLTKDHWVKLRELMQLFGRSWLEKSIDREHKKERLAKADRST